MIYLCSISIITRNPPAHTTFQGFQWILIQGILKDNSEEFLGNHQIRTPIKPYIQGNFQGGQGLGFRADDVDVDLDLDDDGDDDDDNNDDDVVTFNAQVAKMCVAR